MAVTSLCLSCFFISLPKILPFWLICRRADTGGARGAGACGAHWAGCHANHRRPAGMLAAAWDKASFAYTYGLQRSATELRMCALAPSLPDASTVNCLQASPLVYLYEHLSMTDKSLVDREEVADGLEELGG